MDAAFVYGTNDLDLQQRIMSLLAGRYLPSLRRLRVDVREGTVTLSGSVASFYEKQVAIHACRRVAGMRHLVDAVEVARS